MIKAALPLLLAALFFASGACAAVYGIYLLAGAAYAFIAAAIPLLIVATILIRGIIGQ